MSDETTPPASPPDPPDVSSIQSSPARPVPLPVVRLTSEEDTYWIRHLGLPFFYRHTPPKWLLRIGFYSGLALVLGLLCYELIVVPLTSSSYYYYSRRHDLDVVWEFFGIATVISCIIAPLISTFSLCNERVMGTMEFLRLAPLSTTGIVLGKTFGSVVYLHLGALLLMVAGAVTAIAVAGWSTVGAKLCQAVPLIFLSAFLAQAMGALLASLTTFMRGIFPLIVLLGLLFLQHVVPLGMAQASEMAVTGFFSPWGTLNESMEISWRWRGDPPQFLGMEGMATPFVVFAHVVLIALLFRAAARRVDSPMRSALSPLGYLVLWGLLIATCAGIGLNDFRRGSRANGMEAATVLMGVFGVILLGLMILDHPHRREVLLAWTCERIQRGTGIPGSFRRLGHAGLVTILALLGAVLLVLMMLLFTPIGGCDWGWVALILGISPLIAFLLCLFVEANQVGLRSVLLRIGVLIAGCGLLAGLILGIVIDVAYTLNIWQECIHEVRSFDNPKAKPESYSRLATLKAEYPGYVARLGTREEVDTAASLMNERPVYFCVLYHPVRTVIYLCFSFLWMAGVVFWRWHAYRGLRREAEQAVRRQSPPSLTEPRASVPSVS